MRWRRSAKKRRYRSYCCEDRQRQVAWTEPTDRARRYHRERNSGVYVHRNGACASSTRRAGAVQSALQLHWSVHHLLEKGVLYINNLAEKNHFIFFGIPLDFYAFSGQFYGSMKVKINLCLYFGILLDFYAFYLVGSSL